MWSAVLLTGWVFLGQPVPNAAGGERDQLAAQVRRLERQLNDDSLTRRTAAENQLVELGPGILDFLSPITPSTPSEVKIRIARIRKVLEVRLGEALANASLVSLSGELPATEALTVIAKQTGNQIVGHEQRQGSVDISFNKTPFWRALDEVLDQAALNVQSGRQPSQLTVVARPDIELPRSPRASYNGVFRFEPVQVQAFRNLRNPQVNGLKLSLQVAWEPRVQPIALSFPQDKLKLLDAENKPILETTGEGEQEVNVTPLMTSVELDLPFGLPDRSVKKIASMRGTMTAMILGRQEQFTFTALDGAKNVEQRKSAVTVTLQQVRKNLELTEVRLRVKFDKAENSLESHRGWATRNRAYMLDAGGNEVDVAGEEAFLLGDDEIGRVYLFELNKDLATYKFVYTTPGTIIKKPIVFELNDIELP